LKLLVIDALINVSVASDGTIWGVNRNRDIYRWNGVNWSVLSSILTYFLLNLTLTFIFKLFQNRDQVPEKLKQIYTSSERLVVGVNDNNEIYQYVNYSWQKFDGTLNYVAISIDGILWGVASNNEIYTRQDHFLSSTTTSSQAIKLSAIDPTMNLTISSPIIIKNNLDIVIGLAVGLVSVTIISTIAIGLFIWHYKKKFKSISFEAHEQISQVVQS